MEVETTNTPSEQVEETVETIEEASTNSEESPSQDEAYDKAFDTIDLDNPDMSLFTESTNVEEEPEQTTVEDEIPEETAEESDPFALDEDGYLIRTLTDRGKEVKVTPEELFTFGDKGTNYEVRNAEITPFKPYMKVLKEHNVGIEDVKALADFVGGKKEALKHLISKYDVDVYDIDNSEEKYTPETEQYNSNPVEELWTSYQSTNPEESEKVAEVFNGIDEGFRNEVYNEGTFPSFIDDVNKGIFNELYPETAKIKALYPQASWIDAYSEANRRYVDKTSKKVIPNNVGAPRDTGNPSSTGKSKADAIWSDNDAYDEMMKSVTL